MLVDLHVHTFAGGDAVAAPEELIDRALAIGLDGICVTEHDSYEASETAALFAEETGLVVLRGVEVATDLGHLLLYGVEDDGWRSVERNGAFPAQAVVDYAREAGAVAIPAHPFRAGSPSMGDALTSLVGIFAVEGFNGEAMRDENTRACEIAAEFGMRLTGGSDAHMAGHLGRCVTQFERRIETEADLAEELKAGRFFGRYLLGPI